MYLFFIYLFSQHYLPGFDFVVLFCNFGSFMSRRTVICFAHISCIKTHICIQNLVMYWRTGLPLSNHDGPHPRHVHLQNTWNVFCKNRNLLLALEAGKFRINMSENSMPHGDPWFIHGIFYTLTCLACKEPHTEKYNMVTFQRFHLFMPLGSQNMN